MIGTAADIGSTFGEAVVSGPLLVGMLAAMLAGFVSFASPCVVPLVPGYLAYLAGVVGAEAPPATEEQAREQRRTRAGKRIDRMRVVLSSLLFVLGFTVVFVLMSVVFFGLTSTLLSGTQTLQRLGGVVTIVMGLIFIGFVPVLQNERRFSPVRLNTWIGAPLLGAVFGFGWVPCIGPTLGAVLTVAGFEGTSVARGVLLVVAYCLGLGLPFIVVAWGSARAVRAVAFLRRNTRAIQILGGILLICVGLMLVTGVWTQFVDSLRIGSVRTPI